MRSPGGPTAIVVANDQMALGLMAGLRGLGVDVPGQLSVVGFDDNPDAAFYSPPLTTVRIDVAAEARRCVAQVFGHEAPEQGAAPAARRPVLDRTGRALVRLTGGRSRRRRPGGGSMLPVTSATRATAAT